MNIWTKYADYCLFPAIDARSYIYEQCKLADGEYKHNTIPEFILSKEDNNEYQGINSEGSDAEIS